MTTVTISRNTTRLKIRIEGHAGYAEKGKDIICASLSTIVSQMLMVKQIYDPQEQVIIKQNEEKALIEFIIPCRMHERFFFALKAISFGFTTLAVDYPQFVKLIGTIDDISEDDWKPIK